MDQIKVNVTPKEGIVEIRTGAALPLFSPLKIEVNGTLDAPARYFAKMAHDVNAEIAIVTVKRSSGKITLKTNPSDNFGKVIIGRIEEEERLTRFNINTTARMTRNDFVSLLKMNRSSFSSKEQHRELIKQIQSFSANVSSDIAKSSDTRGNKTDMLSKIVTADVLSEFTLKMPIFKGQGALSFMVEVCFEVTDADVRFWLESVDLEELKFNYTNDLIDAQIEALEPLLIIEM